MQNNFHLFDENTAPKNKIDSIHISLFTLAILHLERKMRNKLVVGSIFGMKCIASFAASFIEINFSSFK